MTNTHLLTLLKSLNRTFFNEELQQDETPAAAAKRRQLKAAILNLINENTVEVTSTNP